MAKKRRSKTPKSKPTKVKYKVSIYQIQIKGPEKNKTFQSLLQKMKGKLLKGEPLAQADRFGTVIRSISGRENLKFGSLELCIVKYNQIRTGLSWNIKKSELVTDDGKVNAQKTDLIIYTEHHVAVLVHKPHGPNPSQIKNYLESIFHREAKEEKIDCEIDILPIKVGGSSTQIQSWKTINKFSIEFIKPNPSGTLKAKQLRDILEGSNADKGQLSLTGKTASGLKLSGIQELVEEGDHLVETGQGRLLAEGEDSKGNKEKIDSKNIEVRKFDLQTLSTDLRSLTELFIEKLSKFIS